ncbi:MAG: flippase-like domain-containing protein, partial [Burkholderia sp.]|nr:flippase-like domain-containing protein [Burkholderia sp.]
MTAPSSENAIRPPRHGAAAWLRLAFGCLITLGLAYLLLSRIDLEALLVQLKQANASTLLLAGGAVCIAYAVRITRWWQMLRVSRSSLRMRACISPYMISIAFNNLLPFRLGDFYRVVGFSRQLEISSPVIFASVVVERLIDLAVLLVVLLLGLATWLGASLPKAYVDLAYLLA